MNDKTNDILERIKESAMQSIKETVTKELVKKLLKDSKDQPQPPAAPAWTAETLFQSFSEYQNAIIDAASYLEKGRELERAYDFQSAYREYSAAIKICPGHLASTHLSALLVKMGKLDAAIYVLEQAKQHVTKDEYPPQWNFEEHLQNFREIEDIRKQSELESLDKRIEDIKNKQARGYVYKPRKKP